MKWWIDTDPGVDDALAILTAVSEVAEDLVGFSTVHGNLPEPDAARNLVRLLSAADQRGVSASAWKPMLARGSGTPLAGWAHHPDVRDRSSMWYHGPDGLGGAPWPTPASWETAYESSAAPAIIDACVNGTTSLMCLGPLTNLALAVRLEPDLVRSVERLVIMGGSFRVGGNETVAAEFNFFADPEAANLVLHAGFQSIDLIPLDACDDVTLEVAHWRSLTGICSPAGSLAREVTAHWKDQVKSRRGIGIYDVVAWLLGTSPQLATWQQTYVAVDTGQGIARGASFADWREVAAKPANVRVATAISSPERLLSRFMELLLNG